jgi:hypothetical protein
VAFLPAKSLKVISAVKITLHLHLKFIYFDEIKAKRKKREYRLSEKWKHKLDTKGYTHIRLYRGVEKVSAGTIIDLPYKGYTEEKITHPHFNNTEASVCAIDVAH